jgi:hypothetical protein
MFFVLQNAFSQDEKAFCKAGYNMNFKKTERILHKVIKENRKGQVFFNGARSGYQTNLAPSLDSITNWLKRQECVEDAFRDKCQMKEAIYPGYSSIGVKFKTKNGMIEKCFLIQEGTTGQINIFGWKPKIFKSKTILVYKKMYDCGNFIEQQRINCRNH